MGKREREREREKESWILLFVIWIHPIIDRLFRREEHQQRMTEATTHLPTYLLINWQIYSRVSRFVRKQNVCCYTERASLFGRYRY